MEKNANKIKISVNTKASPVAKTRRPMMDFAPVKKGNAGPRRVKPRVTEKELTRREIARAQVARREEIHRQIEAQNEAEIIAKRRAEAARRELARSRAVEEEAARIRAQKEAVRAEAVRLERVQVRAQERLDQMAATERKRLVAERRAEAARRELARRQAADVSMRRAKVRVDSAEGSVDPIARNIPRETPGNIPLKTAAPRSVPQEIAPTPRPAVKKSTRAVSIKADDDSRRIYGEVSAPEKNTMTRAEREYRALHPELNRETTLRRAPIGSATPAASTSHRVPVAPKPRRSLSPEDLGDINDFTSEIEEDDPNLEDIEDIEKNIAEEDTSENNSRYVLGGRSPFINTEAIVKRPLSGNAGGIGADRLQRPGARLEKPLLGGPVPGTYVSPAEDPRARERARREAEEKRLRALHPELADDNLATNPRYVPYEEPIPHKTLYARRKAADKAEKNKVPTMVVTDSDKGSGIALAVVVLLTIVLGAIVGVIAYLAFFQQ